MDLKGYETFLIGMVAVCILAVVVYVSQFYCESDTTSSEGVGNEQKNFYVGQKVQVTSDLGRTWMIGWVATTTPKLRITQMKGYDGTVFDAKNVRSFNPSNRITRSGSKVGGAYSEDVTTSNLQTSYESYDHNAVFSDQRLYFEHTAHDI